MKIGQERRVFPTREQNKVSLSENFGRSRGGHYIARRKPLRRAEALPIGLEVIPVETRLNEEAEREIAFH